MNGLDLFSGIGGIGLALKRFGVRTVTYCEQDRYAQGVLLSRMQSGELDTAPIWDDVRSLKKEMLPKIDIIFGGFPCQDISTAGNGKGLDGERSGLFFEIVRLVKELNPSFIFLENVPAIRTRGLDRVCFELASIGYDLRWTTLSAERVGANHKRKRWFLLAHASGNRYWIENQQGRSSREDREGSTDIRSNGEIQSVAHADSVRKLSEQRQYDWSSNESKNDANTLCERLERQWEESIGNAKKLNHACDNSWWATEPNVGRVVNGLSNRVDRIKCLGNSVVPLQVEKAIERLIGI